MPFPVSEDLVRRSERELGVTFPVDYVAALMAMNGGAVLALDEDWSLYPVFDDSDRKRLSRTCNDTIQETKASRHWRGFPPDAVAIGDNGSGDRLVFLPERALPNALSSAVFVWSHETTELIPVAASFSALERL